MSARRFTLQTISIFIVCIVSSGFALDEVHAGGKSLPLETVPHVDISKYMGQWHQIAFFPTRFQKNCLVDTTATYTQVEGGRVGVRNECTSTDGKRESIEGFATVQDSSSNAKLKVKFFWFAPAGDYWIIDLGAHYEYAVVGTPSRKYLWILSRSKTMNRVQYDQLVESARAKAFPVDLLQITGTVSP